MPTALEYIHSAAELLGRYDRRQTTSAGAATSSLICSDYVNSVRSSSEFANAHVLIESGACAGEVGMLTNAGLSTSTGALTTADAFSSLIASGVTFSLYGADRLPPLRKGDHPGDLDATNQALERTWVEDTLSFTGVTNQIHYTVDATAWPWFSDDTRIIEIQRPVTNADDVPTVLSRDEWSWVSDGETRKLRFPGAPFRTGETFTVKVNRPGNSRLILNANPKAVLTSTAVTSVTMPTGGYYTALPTITASSGIATFTAVMAATPGPITSVTVNVQGAYTAQLPPALTVTRNASDTGWSDQTSQTAGLVTLTDQAIPDVTVIRPMTVSRVFALLAMMGAPGQTAAEWQAMAATWEAKAVGVRQSRLPRDANAGVMRLRSSSVVAPRRWY